MGGCWAFLGCVFTSKGKGRRGGRGMSRSLLFTRGRVVSAAHLHGVGEWFHVVPGGGWKCLEIRSVVAV